MGFWQHALDPCTFLIFKLGDPNCDASDPVHEIVNSFGEYRMLDDLLGIDCELEKIDSGGRKLHQAKDMEKVKPINYDKKHSEINKYIILENLNLWIQKYFCYY